MEHPARGPTGAHQTFVCRSARQGKGLHLGNQPLQKNALEKWAFSPAPRICDVYFFHFLSIRVLWVISITRLIQMHLKYFDLISALA
jgi:hypothetical protein